MYFFPLNIIPPLQLNLYCCSSFLFIHSDVLRIALLHKYGGTYIDTDIITLKEHPTSCSNFINFEEPGSINGAMMRFTAKHPILDVIGQRLCKK